VTICLGAPYFLNASHPKYSFIGDEWGFFELGNAVVESKFLKNPLSGGVFINNPMLTQMIQAFFMMLFGGDVWGWKAASLVPIALSGLLIFIWSRLWFDELTAYSVALVLAASSYLWSFSLVGYTHQFGVAHLLLLHVLLTLLIKCGDARFALRAAPIVGVVAGLSFFEFGGLVFPVVLLPYAIFLKQRMGDFSLRVPFLVVVIFGVITAIPGLLNAPYRDNVFGLASFSIHELTMTDRINNGLGYLWSFMRMNKSSHYSYGPYVDGVSRVGVIVGALICVFLLARKPRSTAARDRRIGAFLILSATTLAAFAYGTTSPYPEPPRTRGIFMVPHFAMLAGVGFGAIAARLSVTSRILFFSLLFGSIVTLNEIRRDQFFTQMGITPEACVVWKAQRARTAGSVASEVYVFLEDSDLIPGHDSNLYHTVRMANLLLPRYIDPPLRAIEVPRGERPATLSELTINLSDIFRGRCTDLAIEELTGIARGRSNLETKW